MGLAKSHITLCVTILLLAAGSIPTSAAPLSPVDRWSQEFEKFVGDAKADDDLAPWYQRFVTPKEVLEGRKTREGMRIAKLIESWPRELRQKMSELGGAESISSQEKSVVRANINLAKDLYEAKALQLTNDFQQELDRLEKEGRATGNMTPYYAHIKQFGAQVRDREKEVIQGFRDFVASYLERVLVTAGKRKENFHPAGTNKMCEPLLNLAAPR